MDVHDQLVVFRRRMSKDLGFRMRSELKAIELVAGGGPWHKVGTPIRTRYGLYKSALRLIAGLAPVVRAVGVVVPRRTDARLWDGPREDAWDRLFNRLERFSNFNNTNTLLIPDEGSPAQLRTWSRRYADSDMCRRRSAAKGSLVRSSSSWTTQSFGSHTRVTCRSGPIWLRMQPFVRSCRVRKCPTDSGTSSGAPACMKRMSLSSGNGNQPNRQALWFGRHE